MSGREARVWKVLGLVALVSMSVGSVSYARALATPGYATWNDKTSTWVREHGAGPLLDAYENWRYATPPPDTRPTLPLPGRAAVAGGTATSIGTLPTLPTVASMPAAMWTPGRTDDHGAPVAYTAVYQPDPAHRSAVAGVAVISGRATVAQLVAGTAQPRAGDPGRASVSDGDRPSLVAVFNSGWKMSDIEGGYYADRHTVRELRNGQASAVIDDRGHLSVVEWTTDAEMDPHIVAVRQNLALIVDHAATVPALTVNGSAQWGSAENQLQYTERSALGIDADGNIVYVAASKVDLPTLARALADAGAVTGMELDIHSGMTAFNSWSADTAGVLTPTPLLPGVQSSPERYLAADQRDFFSITLAAPTPHQPWSATGEPHPPAPS